MDNYFILNNKKYIIKYQNKNIHIFKTINNQLIELVEEEKKKMIDFLEKDYSYIYDSHLLNAIVEYNPNIEKKEYVLKFLNWLENLIPVDCRENFYKNLKTLKTNLNIDYDFSNFSNIEKGFYRSGGYNTIENSITIEETALKGIWKDAQKQENKEEYYWREYGEILLHELAHMASSRFDSNEKVAYVGFDKYPTEEIEERNRGLTEGFTELIAMAGVPNTIEINSGYYIEACLVNQIMQITGNEVFLKSYFTNQGTKPIEEELDNLINNSSQSFELFRNIEFNFNLRHHDAIQNLLSRIQSSLLDYLEAKIIQLKEANNQEEINNVLNNYEKMIITKERLKVLDKNPDNYYGIDENLIHFFGIKEKYYNKKIERKENQR